ncbi:hypothetical protein [Stenomitos frigidus]
MDCTLYNDVNKPLPVAPVSYTGSDRLKTWAKRHTGLLALLGLLLLSLMVVLVR